MENNMATVSPLTPDQVNEVKLFLERHYFTEVIMDITICGFQVPLRISDLRKIKFSDIRNGVLFFRSLKTGKCQQLKLNNKFMAIVDRRSKNGDEYVFQSHSNRAKRLNSPISASAVYAALSAAGNKIKVNVGTHTFRKTWASNVYKVTNDLGLVQKALQHGSSSQTLRYIGVDQERMDVITSSFEL